MGWEDAIPGASRCIFKYQCLLSASTAVPPFLADKAIMRLYLLISMQYAVLPQSANILIRGNMEQMRLTESFCKMYLECLV